ncbi:MAG: hypothetical protein LUF35_08740 [Lachnospiraceae bacterium]|nr:hypothetical protein [Lachnospiraceae bacterium]
MFLDFIQSAGGKKRSQGSGSNLQVRRPQIVVLVGNFEEVETEALMGSFQKHFPSDSYLFWICLGGSAPSFSHTYHHAVSDGGEDYLKRREGYVGQVKEKEMRSFLVETVADIYNGTAGLKIQESGGVQVALLAKAEQPEAGMLSAILPLLKRELNENFPLVNMDAYLVVDQSAFRDHREEKEAVIYLSLSEMQKLMEKRQLRLAYVLSNLNNKGQLLAGADAAQEQYAAIALMIAMKNLIPNNEQFRYSDESYGKAVTEAGQSIGLGAGLISSVGHMRLQTDEMFNALVAYRTVWQCLGEVDENLETEERLDEIGLSRNAVQTYFKEAVRIPKLSVEDFEAIARNSSIDDKMVLSMRCGDAITGIFGNNLALYQELNTPSVSVEQKLSDWQDNLKKKIRAFSDQISFFDLALLLEEAEEEIHELNLDMDEIVSDRKRRLAEWEERIFASAGGAIPKNTSPVFVLAQQYLERKNALYLATQQKKMIDGVQDRLKSLGRGYRDYKALVLETLDSIDGEIAERQSAVERPGNGLGKLQITNAVNYYSEVTQNLVAQDQDHSFRYLKDKLREILNMGSLDEVKIFEYVQDYCQKQIFSDAGFHMDFLRELQSRLTGYDDGVNKIQNGTDVSDFLVTQIVDAQHYLFYDRITGGQQAYEEMPMCLQSDDIFTQHKNQNAHLANTIKTQKIRLFCNRNCDGMDVLFLAGNLRMENLHKWDIYEEAYQELTGGDRDAISDGSKTEQ